MEISNMKNIVVLKNLPSNIVEEAIVILKSNQKIKKLERVESKNNNSKQNINNKLQNNNDYIVNEAEMLISNYITSIEKNKFNNNSSSENELKKKYNKMKLISMLLGLTALIQIILNII